MKEIILDTIIDGIKLYPFLFIAFFVIEYIEHKMKNKNVDLISREGKKGPIIGSLIGVVPQCGFSALTTNLYASRIVSLGTLIAVYLSTSDEMLPILISENASISLICLILAIKVGIGMLFGLIIDIIFRKREITNYSICKEEHCHCEESILKGALEHSLKIFSFILVVSFIINLVMDMYGMNALSKIFMKGHVGGIFISSLMGLIPNCAASVIITELYLKSAISFSALISGLLTGSGIALIVLFRVNNCLKENIKILLLLFSCGVIGGLLVEIVMKILSL